MIEVMKHRAPDDRGFFHDPPISLGMGRLKIIDLVSDGLCPYTEDHFVLCFNGEIYNYIELRKELEQLGWIFRTKSDTEVLMKAWRAWGLQMFDKLNGMFAFAIYDSLERRLILARDIAGEKPLYFCAASGQFHFASEAKAFKPVLPLQYQPNRFFESFQHCLVNTLWAGVEEVPAAHYLSYDLGAKSYEIKPYWELHQRSIDLQNPLEELEYLLDDAVRIRTRSDVPYGLYFSGGIDSSLLSTCHDFEHKFFFDDSDEWKDDFFLNLSSVVWHLDFPVGSLSCYPLWKLAEWASREVKVVLSGEGADELFGGYVRYLPIAREWELRKRFPSYSYLLNKYYPTYVDGFANITARNQDLDLVRAVLAPHFARFEDPISAMGFADFKLVMPSLLQMGDRMASAFGIENRCPFLDRRIIEFAYSLPPEMKINGLEQKLMLRGMLERRGLLEPLNMEKKGLSIVFNKWLDRDDWDRSSYFHLLKDRWTELYFGDQKD